MPIKFKCEHCEQVLSVSSTKAGKGAKCPKCHQSILIPNAPTAPAIAAQELVTSRTETAEAKSRAAQSGAKPLAKTATAETPMASRGVNDTHAIEKLGFKTTAPQAGPAVNAVSVESWSPTLSEKPAVIGPLPAPPSSIAPITPPSVKTPPATEVAPPPDSDEPPEGDDPFSQFVVYDDGAEIVYASDDVDEQAAVSEIDRDALAVPRSVLYMQGVLLGVVAVVCFALGVLVGGTRIGAPINGPHVAKPCQVSGSVVFRDRRQAASPDDGSVVVLLPQESRPDEKAQVLGLRPDDPTPDENHSALAAIRSFGGDYARADSEGRYRLRVSDTGSYFVLFISRNSKRKSDESLKNADLAQLGRYFTDAVDLIGENRYRWKVERIQGDRLLSEEFN